MAEGIAESNAEGGPEGKAEVGGPNSSIVKADGGGLVGDKRFAFGRKESG